jgi:hypothetical protein
LEGKDKPIYNFNNFFFSFYLSGLFLHKINIMKNLFTLILLMQFVYIAKAQPTITTAALPVSGVTYHQVSADNSSFSGLSSMLTAGANQTWNCNSTFIAFDTTHQKFVVASTTPYATTFGTSNLAYDSPVDSIYTYMHTNANGLYIDGIYSYKAGLVSGDGHYANGGQLVLPTPFSLGSTNVAPGVFTAVKTIAIIFTAGVYRTETRNSIADAWGTIITPSDTFTNVLRIKTKVTSYDSIFLPAIVGQAPAPSYDTAYEYTWVQNVDSIGQIMTVTTGSDSTTINGATYNYKKRKSINGINDIKSNNAFKVYPNPANDFLNIQLEKQPVNGFQVIVSDILGRKMINKTENKQLVSLDVKSLNSGTYFLQIIQDGKTTARKFVVR